MWGKRFALSSKATTGRSAAPTAHPVAQRCLDDVVFLLRIGDQVVDRRELRGEVGPEQGTARFEDGAEMHLHRLPFDGEQAAVGAIEDEVITPGLLGLAE